MYARPVHGDERIDADNEVPATLELCWTGSDLSFPSSASSKWKQTRRIFTKLVVIFLPSVMDSWRKGIEIERKFASHERLILIRFLLG